MFVFSKSVANSLLYQVVQRLLYLLLLVYSLSINASQNLTLESGVLFLYTKPYVLISESFVNDIVCILSFLKYFLAPGTETNISIILLYCRLLSNLPFISDFKGALLATNYCIIVEFYLCWVRI